MKAAGGTKQILRLAQVAGPREKKVVIVVVFEKPSRRLEEGAPGGVMVLHAAQHSLV